MGREVPPCGAALTGAVLVANAAGMIKPFKPDGVVPFPGVLWCVAIAAAAAVASGYLMGFISHLGFSFLIVWPMIMGLGAGGGALLGLKQGAVRNVLVGWMVGGLAGVLAVGASHHVSYLLVKREVVRETTENVGDDGEQVSPAEAEAFFDDLLEAKTTSRGFVGFVRMEASQGTSITRHGKTTQVGEDGTLLLWALEVLLGLAISVAVSRKQAAQPFCARCNAWYKEAGTRTLEVGRVDDVKRMFEASSLARLAEAAARQVGPREPHGVLTLKECKECTLAEPVMTLEKITYDRKNREHKTASGAWLVGRVQAHEAMASLK